MKKLMTAALLASVATSSVTLPAAANAQSNQELRHDRRDIRQDRRDLRNDRRDYRDDARDRNHAWRDDDWRGWRERNRTVFARGAWTAPFRYTRFAPGARIGAIYFGPRFVIADPWRYHLPAAGWGRVWVRHYNDLLLVDTRRGIVIRVIPNFYW